VSDPFANLSELIDACFESPRDQKALTRLNAELRPYLLAVLASVNRCGRDQIEDAYQSAFIQFILIFRAGRRRGVNYEAYFVAVAKNCLFDLVRKERRLVAIDEVLESEFALPPNDEEARTDARITVWQALQRLDRPCQFLLERHYLEGFTAQELADEDDVTIENIRVRLSRCRARMKQVLDAAKRG